LVSRVQPGAEVQAEFASLPSLQYDMTSKTVKGCALIRGGTWLHHEAGQPEPVDQVVSGPI
jgi:hypothetical protein